jgi:hypothetical protein
VPLGAYEVVARVKGRYYRISMFDGVCRGFGPGEDCSFGTLDIGNLLSEASPGRYAVIARPTR